ncbi:MAG TPA: TolC family protein, partial [Bacteroidales bacterium]|nr:TolC family protein [Bacteroidales bacterium]
TLDVNQVIYDGGAIKISKELENADLKLNEKQSEADIYKIRSQVNTIYFSILLANRQEELQKNFLSLLNNRIQLIESAVRNGVRMRSDADMLRAEKIRVGQQLADITIKKISMIKVLSELTGIQVDSSAKLILPENINIDGDEIKRPELDLFDLRQEQLDAGISMAGTKRLPKAFGFASLGYGNPPGNNFFKDQFDTYYMIGAGIKWNIFDWSKSKNEKKVISTQKTILENRKNDLSDNIRRQLDSKRAEIESLEMMAASDSELITLRKSISAASESQYQNGTITSTEYLDALNSEKQAVINSEIHRISLAMAKADYLNISGKELE